MEGTPRIQRCHPNGEKLWSQRIEANPEDGFDGPGDPFPDWLQFYTAAISVQADDSIVLTINRHASNKRDN